MKTNIILNGDALQHLKELPEESINCVMTSPPYWALRDYGIEGQLGLEPTFEEYIKKLRDIFDEVKRVLRKDGTCWINIGDTYYGSGKGAGGDISNSKQVWGFENKEKKICEHCGDEFEGYAFQKFCGSACSGVDNTPRFVKDAIEWKRKSREEYSKVGIEKECLYCGKKIKGKPNSQFCSRTCLNKLGNEFRSQRRMLPDKCLTLIPQRFAIEMVNRGWILRNTIIWHKPNCMPSSVKDRFTVDFEYLFFFVKNKKYWFEKQLEPHQSNWRDQERMRISRDEGRIEYEGKWKGREDAESCGSPRARTQRPNQKAFVAGNEEGRNKRCVWKIPTTVYKEAHFAVYPEELCRIPIKSGCPEGGIVLDPFFGAGTTGVVALKQNKKFIGIELNPDYIEIAKKRLKPLLEQTKLEKIKK